MPVSENSPAPMIAPMPSPTRLQGPSVRSRPWPPSASRRRRSIGFVRISPSATLSRAIVRPPRIIKEGTRSHRQGCTMTQENVEHVRRSSCRRWLCRDSLVRDASDACRAASRFNILRQQREEDAPMCRIFAEQTPERYAYETRSLRIGGHCTSLRLETAFWTILEEIARQEGLSVAKFATKLHDECWNAMARCATSPRSALLLLIYVSEGSRAPALMAASKRTVWRCQANPRPLRLLFCRRFSLQNGDHFCEICLTRILQDHRGPLLASMIVGELVLPEVMRGIAEASATRRPRTPRTRRRHRAPRRHRDRPHPGGADGVEDRGAEIARGLEQVGVAGDPGPGRCSSGR